MLDFIGLCVTPALLFYRNWQDYIWTNIKIIIIPLSQTHESNFQSFEFIDISYWGIFWLSPFDTDTQLAWLLKNQPTRLNTYFLIIFITVSQLQPSCQSNKQTDRQTDKQTNKQTNRDMISNSTLLRLWCIYSCQVSLLLHRKDPTGEPGNDKNQCL